MVAGTHSGVGKTTVATGLMAALRRRGVAVAAAKVGPDFIDPGYHQLATGRPSRNLDGWLCGPETLAPLAARASRGAQVLVVEGVMGLFDGVGAGHEASTAAVAEAIDAPVVLVVDAAAMSASVAAVVYGFHIHRPGTRLAGVVLNRVGSDHHEAVLREALAPVGVPVLGALRRDPRLAWRDRHLGLVPVVERPDEVRRALDVLSEAVTAGVDLEAVMAVARTAPTRAVTPLAPARPSGRAVVAVCGGPAFSFAYRDNLERLAEAGATLVELDPTVDPRLPDGTQALYAGGGFPEVYAGALADNRPLLEAVRRAVTGGLPTWAECGGLLWLCRSLDGHQMAGIVPADATMTDRLTLGYRTAKVRAGNPVAPPGASLRGHEFHYSELDPAGDALDLDGRRGPGRGGWAGPGLLASYLHLHLGADATPAQRFVGYAAGRPPPGTLAGAPAAVRR